MSASDRTGVWVAAAAGIGVFFGPIAVVAYNYDLMATIRLLSLLTLMVLFLVPLNLFRAFTPDGALLAVQAIALTLMPFVAATVATALQMQFRRGPGHQQCE